LRHQFPPKRQYTYIRCSNAPLWTPKIHKLLYVGHRQSYDFYTGCSFCRTYRQTLWYRPANWRAFIRWSPDQWVSQCCAIECYRSFCCPLVSAFMTRVSQCPVSVRSEHSLLTYFLFMFISVNVRYTLPEVLNWLAVILNCRYSDRHI
jgi:hypothetical protein